VCVLIGTTTLVVVQSILGIVEIGGLKKKKNNLKPNGSLKSNTIKYMQIKYTIK